jgi:uncharacterized protein YcbK (DUF882 family)
MENLKQPPRSSHFGFNEFQCKDGTPVPPELWDNLSMLLDNLEVIREVLKKPMIINSGYRTVVHNKRVKGAKNSMHIQAKAADIRVNGIKSSTVYKLIIDLIDKGFIVNGGVGLYPKFVHYDIGKSRRW